MSVNVPDGKVIEYVHDPLRRRIAKKVNGVITEKYLWQGLTRLVAIYDSNENLLMRFEYADGRMPVAMTKENATYYLSYNQVGSLILVADASGNVVKRVEYDSFGNVIDDTVPTFEVPFGFAGGLHDRDTGLVRFGYRDYDPDVGRWTAKDPIFFAGGDTDLYGYVLNDPINAIDPDGLHERSFRHSHSGKDTGYYGHSNKITGNITLDKAYDNLHPLEQQSVDHHERTHIEHPFWPERKVLEDELDFIQDQINKLPPNDPNRELLENWKKTNEKYYEEKYGQKPCP